MIEISIKKQKLNLIDDFEVVKEYQISTALNGIGNEYGSGKTPFGNHCICEKIGDGAALGTVFQKRVNTGIISQIYNCRQDYPYDVQAPCITTRIIRLEGLEAGKNKGENIDSFIRCIYIHGTPYEFDIGSPSSRGCVRMKNTDIVELFNLVIEGDEVFIK